MLLVLANSEKSKFLDASQSPALQAALSKDSGLLLMRQLFCTCMRVHIYTHKEYVTETVCGPKSPKYLLSGTVQAKFADVYSVLYS